MCNAGILTTLGMYTDPGAAASVAGGSGGWGSFAQGAGGALEAYSAYSSGQAASDQQRFQSRIAKNNARFAKQEAGLIREQGYVAQENVDLKADILRGQGRAGFANANIVVDRDTALTWDVDLAVATVREKAAIEYQTDLDVWRANQQSANFLSEAKLLRLGAKQSRQGGRLRAAGSAFSSIGQAFQ